jgi:hypothetical protein
VFAVVARVIYGDILPSRFGDVLLSIYSLFSIITLDDWSVSYYSPLSAKGQPSSIIFFMAFIILETFICVNLFVAVIVNNLQRVKTYSEKIDRKEGRQEREELKKMAQVRTPSCWIRLLRFVRSFVPPVRSTFSKKHRLMKHRLQRKSWDPPPNRTITWVCSVLSVVSSQTQNQAKRTTGVISSGARFDRQQQRTLQLSASPA